jgi:tetratricopeptide (TPR) repeat protein
MWASFSTDEQSQRARGEVSEGYFEKALKLSPNSARLWDEWALLYLSVLGQDDKARDLLEYSLQIDPLYDWTHAMLGEYYNQKAQDLSDPQDQANAFGLSTASYEEALRLAGDPPTKVGYLTTLAQLYIDQDQPEKAVAAITEAMQLAPQNADLWRYEHTLAQLYYQMGDKAQAIQHANQALALAPADQQPVVQSLIAQLQSEP